MIKSLSSIAIGALALSVASAAQADQSRVRVVHASPDAPAVDVLVDGGVAFAGASFSDVTGYANLAAGDYNVQVVPAGAAGPAVIDADLTLDLLTDYTVLAVNTLDQIEPLVLVDDNALDAANARIRFVHASPNAPAVDITLTDGTVLFGDIEFKEVGDYIAVPGGSYDLEVRLAGTNMVVLSLPGIAVDANRVYTVYALGLVGGTPALQAGISVDSEAETRIRVVHASPDAPAVDVLVNDGLAFGNLPFTGITDYATLAYGDYNVKVVPAGATDPVVIDADVSLGADTEFTVLAVDALANIAPLVLVDDNTVMPDMARVRFVHASPDAPAVDITLADGTILFPKIAFTGVGDYIAVPPGTYDLQARVAGTDIVALEIPGVVLEADRVYTAYAVGFLADIQAILSQDAAACPGNLNGDGFVDVHDLLLVLANWNTAGPGDVDGDGVVAINDLLTVLIRWGSCP